MLPVGDADEEVVAPVKRRGKRKPLSADLPRIEVIHELPEHELCHQRRNQRAAGYRADADPCD
ncbi:ISPsy5, transposase [Pseudomonas syringae pv. theae ICMP 3923]|nr:ISPsy5, transposase [Pseudomonas syringae pv. theae ICMP 3923]